MTKEEMIFRTRCTPIVEKWMRDKGLDLSAKVAVINQIISKTQKQEPMKDLTKILKDGDEVYYIVTGKMHEIVSTKNKSHSGFYSIVIDTGIERIILSKYGQSKLRGECLIFPSKEERNWDNFKRKEEFKKGDLCAFHDGDQGQKCIGIFHSKERGFYFNAILSDGEIDQFSPWKYCEKINIEDYI